MTTKRFFTADLHFGHAAMVSVCNRPWTVEEQDREIIRRWNRVVSPSDFVTVCGDFSMSHKYEYLKSILLQLNGTIDLITGNHDDERVFNLLSHDKELHGRVRAIGYYREYRIDGTKIVCCHFPMEVWNSCQKGAIHLHGHCHGTLHRSTFGRRGDCGIDVTVEGHTQGNLFSQDEVLEIWGTREIAIADCHKPKG